MQSSVTTYQSPNKLIRKNVWIGALLRHWEIYLIMLIAVILHFYRVDTSDFDSDQMLVWRMAYDAVHHGWIPVTASTASLGFANAPGLVYLLMLPALFTANPLAGVFIINSLASIAVLITYIFTTRYYGRIAGTIAALLYATAGTPVLYSRFLWQPNMMYLFVILFMFMLFRGAVEHRQGWLCPALVLFGIVYQAHATTLVLLVPFVMTLFFAPETVRRRDIGYAIIGLLIVFFPFILWHLSTRFSDVSLILATTNRPVSIDTQALSVYRYMLSPYDHNNPPTNPLSYVVRIIPYISKLYVVVFALVVCGFLLAIIVVIWQWRMKIQVGKTEKVRKGWRERWEKFTPTPEGAGLLLLCAWQIVPILAMTRHTSVVFQHYMLVILPGPFILIGYFIAWSGRWVPIPTLYLRNIFRLALYSMLLLIILAQIAGSAAAIQDRIYGYFYDHGNGQYYNDLYSLQNATNAADQLATQKHLKRIFMGVDFSTETMLYYFGEHMQHQTTVFSLTDCLVLPGAEDGPAILVIPPYNDIGDNNVGDNGVGNMIVKTYGAVLLKESPHLGGSSFKIYEIPAAATQNASQQNTLSQELQPAGPARMQQFGADPTRWMVSPWTLLQNKQLEANKTYSYRFASSWDGKNATTLYNTCTFSAAHAGDQVLALKNFPATIDPPKSINVNVTSYDEGTDTPIFGPFHLETHRRIASPDQDLRLQNGNDTIPLPVQ